MLPHTISNTHRDRRARRSVVAQRRTSKRELDRYLAALICRLAVVPPDEALHGTHN